MTIHSLIIFNGATVNFNCQDGLSPIEKLNIEHIYRFGGDMRFIDCGADNEFVGLYQALNDMLDKYLHA